MDWLKAGQVKEVERLWQAQEWKTPEKEQLNLRVLWQLATRQTLPPDSQQWLEKKLAMDEAFRLEGEEGLEILKNIARWNFEMLENHATNSDKLETIDLISEASVANQANNGEKNTKLGDQLLQQTAPSKWARQIFIIIRSGVIEKNVEAVKWGLNKITETKYSEKFNWKEITPEKMFCYVLHREEERTMKAVTLAQLKQWLEWLTWEKTFNWRTAGAMAMITDHNIAEERKQQLEQTLPTKRAKRETTKLVNRL